MNDEEFKAMNVRGDSILRNIALYKDGVNAQDYDKYCNEAGTFINARACAYDGTCAALMAAGIIK